MNRIGIDDTDSQTLGMCTTYVGHLIKTELVDRGYTVDHLKLIRLNPSAKHKTRGNASVVIHTTAPVDVCMDVASEIVFANAAVDDPKTNPGIVVGTDSQVESMAYLQSYTKRAIQELLDLEEVVDELEQSELKTAFKGNGRGRIGALAAISADLSLDEWTYEYISYREAEQFGTERDVDIESVFEASQEYYPSVWDTVDMRRGEAVCIPNTPCPILYGIRGDDSDAVVEASTEIDGESVSRTQLFKTNQGTDVHLQTGTTQDIRNNCAYKLTGVVSEPPVREEGGHLFFEVEDEFGSLQVVAFEPTKHFRDILDHLRNGDTVTVCGEVTDGTLKLEKIRVNSVNRTEYQNPVCSGCGNTMKSAGRNAGYRCRDCGTSADSKQEVTVERDLEEQWYEVPPCARRHISKPLTRFTETEPTYIYRETDHHY